MVWLACGPPVVRLWSMIVWRRCGWSVERGVRRSEGGVSGERKAESAVDAFHEYRDLMVAPVAADRWTSSAE